MILSVCVAMGLTTIDSARVWADLSHPTLPRVVGGTLAPTEHTPWFVIVQQNPQMLCGGAVIGPQWVVTAAHCVDSPNLARNQSVTVNPASFNANTFRARGGQRVAIAKTYIHPGYIGGDDYFGTPPQNDIALVRTRTFLNSVSLPFSSDVAGPAANDPLVTVGFGATSPTSSVSSKLRTLNVNDLAGPTGECGSYGSRYEADKMLCGGSLDGTRRTCDGDSGGPLMTPGFRSLVGLVGWSSGCSDASSPSVFTRVSTYAQWVAQVTHISPNMPAQPSFTRVHLKLTTNCGRSSCAIARDRQGGFLLSNRGGSGLRWRTDIPGGLKVSQRKGYLGPGRNQRVVVTALGRPVVCARVRVNGHSASNRSIDISLNRLGCR